MTKSITSHRNLLLLIAALLAPSFAQAHTGVGVTHGFAPGFIHPLTGLDHLCAMLAVGLWAAQLGGRALWIVPTTFLAVMAAGGAMGMAGVHLPLVEQTIAVSVLVLGLILAAAVKLPTSVSATIVGLFALFHGHSHGTEMLPSLSGLTYGIGFILATATLLTAGITLGIAARKLSTAKTLRLAGAAIAACGAYIIFFGA